MADEPTDRELIEQGERLMAEAATSNEPRYVYSTERSHYYGWMIENGPRLLALARRAVEMEERLDEAVQLLALIEANDYSVDDATAEEVRVLLRGPVAGAGERSEGA